MKKYTLYTDIPILNWGKASLKLQERFFRKRPCYEKQTDRHRERERESHYNENEWNGTINEGAEKEITGN